MEIKSEGDEDSNLDVQTLLDRIFRLKALLRNANQRSENPLENLDDLLYEGWDLESNASKWKKTANLLKEQLEQYKREADRGPTRNLLYNADGIEEFTSDKGIIIIMSRSD